MQTSIRKRICWNSKVFFNNSGPSARWPLPGFGTDAKKTKCFGHRTWFWPWIQKIMHPTNPLQKNNNELWSSDFSLQQWSVWDNKIIHPANPTQRGVKAQIHLLLSSTSPTRRHVVPHGRESHLRDAELTEVIPTPKGTPGMRTHAGFVGGDPASYYNFVDDILQEINQENEFKPVSAGFWCIPHSGQHP